jgi:hypothetical protein
LKVVSLFALISFSDGCRAKIQLLDFLKLIGI